HHVQRRRLHPRRRLRPAFHLPDLVLAPRRESAAESVARDRARMANGLAAGEAPFRRDTGRHPTAVSVFTGNRNGGRARWLKLAPFLPNNSTILPSRRKRPRSGCGLSSPRKSCFSA